MNHSLSIVLTGAAGNLGRKLREHWRGHHHVRAIDIDPRGDQTIMRAELAAGDPVWASVLAGADVVVHCAANGSPTQSWEEGHRNVGVTFNVFEAARMANVRRVVYISSNHVMGGYKDQAEPRLLTAALPPRPGAVWQRDGRQQTSHSYGLSKLCGEEIARCFADSHGLEVLCVRVGWVQTGDNRVEDMPAHMDDWTRAMWLSNADLCRLLDACVGAALPGRFLIVNGMSANAGMRWDIAAARETIGYVPEDGWPGR
ncbi:MAG TPA: NAD(P)-dependent oxidoreductase [Polyangia bacterium]|jgi:nucleoside-diphosphate-sugar epimerase